MKNEIPMDALGVLDGSYYKIGRFGKAYYWNGGEWRKSEKHTSQVESDISKKKNPFSM